ncbi:heme biosynthesis HemY N-terminal domain-containing protein [Psychrosphaera aquimarina]|uniref:Heme biosynthesis HemY N-terminal domain-containing protein n=1 Tax=Psychrosphaera aquimarina TaxID=2044854 RepID=A0ABU3QZ81_9GAMM|nr:heme biosynthesis HemY N-terminal domain-containing protein [Psychrosphaera aquimarina]MDU0112527.1 heme biosynthesis HemY N-terminal domain-containing protein [Psychrosphaera aquimarina]
MTKLVKGFLLLAIFGALVFIAPQLMGEQGYLLISLGNWTIEGSVVQFAILLIISSLVLYGLWLAIKYLILVFIMPTKWWQNRYAKTHANYFQTGVDYMALGQWKSAAEQFLKVKRISKKQTAAELALVCAARAYDPELSRNIVKNLESNFEQNDVNQQFSSLFILVQQQQFSEALLVLNKLNLPVLKQTIAFQQLWLVIQVNNHAWNDVNKYLPKIHKLALKQAEAAVEEWHQHLFDTFNFAFVGYIEQYSNNQLQQVWNNFSKANQQIHSVSEAYIAAIAAQGVSKQVETILCDSMNFNGYQWVLNNVRRCYQVTEKVHMDALFSQVQKHINKHKEDKILLTIFAYLAAGQKDPQLAKQALEQVIYSNKNNLDTRLYANVLADLGEVRHSVEVFQSMK